MLELDTPTNSQRDDMFSYLLLAASSVSAGVTILFSPLTLLKWISILSYANVQSCFCSFPVLF
jgi:hypothetical protein